jgi:hypothetical protein
MNFTQNNPSVISHRHLCASILSVCLPFLLSGCLMTRSEAGRSAGYDTIDLTIGVLPVSGSLNPEQNMFPGLARAMNQYGRFKSIEPAAAHPEKKFDLLLMCGPPGFAPDIKLVSGYTGKELFSDSVVALYGMGAKTAVNKIAEALSVGTPAYQRIMADRAVYRKEQEKALAATTISKDEMRAMLEDATKKVVGTPKPEPPATRSFVSEVDTPAYQLKENPNNFAIVIGIEKYSEVPEAQHAERDAEAFKNHLLALGYPRRNIIHLAGEKAGRAGIEKFVETWLPRNVNENSRVFFYFSGHGAPDAETKQAYLVPWDGDPKFLENTAYPVKRLYEKLNALSAKEVVVALDTCFSGLGGRSVVPKGSRPMGLALESPLAAIGRLVVFTASANDEISGSDDTQGHGLFTYYFLKGLNGSTKEPGGRITAKGLYNFLQPEVQNEARRQNRSQTPQLLSSQSGNLATLTLR